MPGVLRTAAVCSNSRSWQQTVPETKYTGCKPRRTCGAFRTSLSRLPARPAEHVGTNRSARHRCPGVGIVSGCGPTARDPDPGRLLRLRSRSVLRGVSLPSTLQGIWIRSHISAIRSRPWLRHIRRQFSRNRMKT